MRRGVPRYPPPGPARRIPSAPRGSHDPMNAPDTIPEITITAPALAALKAHLAADGTAKYVRIHVGRG